MARPRSTKDAFSAPVRSAERVADGGPGWTRLSREDWVPVLSMWGVAVAAAAEIRSSPRRPPLTVRAEPGDCIVVPRGREEEVLRHWPGVVVIGRGRQYVFLKLPIDSAGPTVQGAR